MTDPGGGKWLYPGLALACALLVVAAAGFAMQATDQAAFCGSCHVMREAALTHKQSVHAKLACNECHAPAGLAAKIPFKMASGASDVSANLFKRYADVIHAQKNHKDTVNANCIRCHEATVATAAMDMKPYCADCHRQVPHKAATPISTRKVADG